MEPKSAGLIAPLTNYIHPPASSDALFWKRLSLFETVKDGVFPFIKLAVMEKLTYSQTRRTRCSLCPHRVCDANVSGSESMSIDMQDADKGRLYEYMLGKIE